MKTQKSITPDRYTSHAHCTMIPFLYSTSCEDWTGFLKSLIPFLLQTSLSLSYLLHNLMSQELFGEASKYRKKKKRKLNRKKLEGKSLIRSTLPIYSVREWRQTLKMGLGDAPPLHLFQPDRKYIRSMCLFGAESTSWIQLMTHQMCVL